MSEMLRHPMTPTEYDAAKRRLLELHPYLSVGSGKRTQAHNDSLPGSNPNSKHVVGMGDDLSSHERFLSEFERGALVKDAKTLGMWAIYHDVGTGSHLHIQGLPPGEIAG